MNNIILIILMIALSNGFVFAQTEPLDTDGNGYRNISTLEQLRWISENDSSWSWKFELDNDINAADTKKWNNGEGWSPIGNKAKPFKGSFDGNGFEIDSIYINLPSQTRVGLFGHIVGSRIRNVGVVNCVVMGNDYVGGLVGNNFSSTVSNCYSTGKVSGSNQVGSLVGGNSSSKVINSYSTGSVDGNEQIGGLVGSNSLSKVINSYTTCNISGIEQVGGLVGGNSTSTVHNSYSSGRVTGIDNIGGLVGYNPSSSIINSYSTGSIEGNFFVGGLVGSNDDFSTVYNSYSTSSVSGNEQVGGLVGANFSSLSTVASSFWDIQSSGQATSAGGTGKTTEEMKTKSTFTNAGWNFNFIWDISTAYPIINIDISYRPNDTDADGFLNISTLTDLRWLSESGIDLDSDCEMDNDINAADTKNWNGTLGFSPIGTYYATSFSGEFEGHGYKIDSLYINRPNQSYVGLFGKIGGAEIRNVGMVNCDIKGKNVVGGLVGGNISSTVINSYSSGSVLGGYYIGGLVGYTEVSKVRNSYSRSHVVGTGSYVGGLVGYHYLSSSVINCYSTGSVEATGNNVGGLVGENFSSEMLFSFWDTQTSGIDSSAGGPGCTGKSTSEMKAKSTFTDAGWDFENIWTIDSDTNDGYPYFRDIPSIILENETIPEKNILVYPNPAEDYIEISIDGAQLEGGHHQNVEIYNVLGNVVINYSTPSLLRNATPCSHPDLSGQEGNFKIDVSHLPKGVYFVKIGNKVEKFVKM